MKKLLKDITIYGIGGVLTKAISFILLPLYTRVLVPADYGTLEFLYVVSYIISILYGWMVSSGYIRFYFDSKDLKSREKYLGSAFWFTFVNSLVFASLSFIFADKIAAILFKFDNAAFFLKLITISIVINAHKQILYNLLQVKEEPKKYILINIISLVLTLGGTIFFVAYLRWGVKGVLLAQIIGFTLEFLILAFLNIRRSIICFSYNALKKMLKYSTPLIPIQIAFFVTSLSDRFFLQHYKTLNEVGIYSLGYKLASIIPLFAIYPLKAFTPYIFSLINTPQICKAKLADFTRYYLAAILLIAFIISLYSREIIMIVSNKAYYSSWTVVYFLSLSCVFYGLINVSAYAIEIVKKNWISSIFWIFAALISIVSNLILVPLYGVIGASISSMISYLVIAVCYLTAIKYIYPVPYNYFKFILLIILTSLFFYLSTFFRFSIINSIICKSILLLLYVFVGIFCGYFTRKEINSAKNAILSLLFLKSKR